MVTYHFFVQILVLQIIVALSLFYFLENKSFQFRGKTVRYKVSYEFFKRKIK